MRIRPSLLALLAACSNTGTTTAPAEMGPVPPMPKAQERVAGSAKVTAVPMPLIAASSQQMPLAQTAAPFTLTASDGSGLVATRVEAKAVVQGPLAFTELHLYFANTENRVREGTFAITLPPGAAVSRFAMENNGQWMEAEVVEKQLARRAYEDFLHRKQDPALMEKAEGNQFTARVFPIPAQGEKHLVLSFSQELPGERYVLPLRGLPKVARVDVSLTTSNLDGSRAEQKLSERNWQPDRDFVSTANATAEAITAGQLVVAQLSPFDQATVAKDTPRDISLFVDTSASRALGFERYAQHVRELIGTLAKQYPGVTVDVVAFDQDTQSIYTGPAAGFGTSHLQALITRGAAGASDLSRALTSVTPKQRVVIITDGVVTAGSEGDELTAKIKALKQVERVDVVLAGGIRDEALAMALVTTGLPRTGAVMDLDASVAYVANGIGERVMSDVAVTVEGASWVYPSVIKSARPHQRMMVYARLAKPAPTMTVKIGQMRREVGTVGGTPALIERAVAAAEIAGLEAALGAAKPDAQKAMKATIAQKAVAARVISSQTSMLVLESEGDYARYGIDRKSLADILVIGPNGVEQSKRAAQLATSPKAPTQVPTTKNMVAKDEQDPGAPLAEPADKKPSVTTPMEAPKAAMADDSSGDMEELRESTADARSMAPSPPPPPPPPGAPRPSLAQSESAPERDVTAASGSAAPMSFQRRRIMSDSGDTYEGGDQWPPPGSPAPLRGTLAQIDGLVRSGKIDDAIAKARDWHAKAPGDVLALIGYGQALEAQKDLPRAARMYGSIIDLFPARADLRRFAGERLERIGEAARSLAVDTYKHAVEERPDHLSGHRLLAYALLRDGKHAEAFAAILAGLAREYPDGRFESGKRILAEDAGMIGAAYAAADPTKRGEVVTALRKHGAQLPTGPSTRFIMYWETDANDVDFHIQDVQGGHAFYSNKQLPSGGELYADITTGYGPECFAIQGRPTAGPYKLSINYYSQGPMGYGMGLLQIVKYDGKGHLAFQDRPYVIMNDHAYVDLGTYKP